MESAHYLGILADTVRTQAVLTDAGGHRLASTTVAHSGVADSRDLLKQVLHQVVGGQSPPGPIQAAVALPGLTTPAHRRSAAALVEGAFPSDIRVLLCDRWEALLAGSLGASGGLLVFSGLEAAAARVDPQGNFSYLEAPDDLLGCEGSGLWLGTRTLQMAARMVAGRMPASSRLEKALANHFGCRSLSVLLERADELGAEQVVELASVVVGLSAYPDPEPACRALVLQASRRLVSMAQELSAGSTETASWGGSVLQGALLEEVCRSLPTARFQAPRQDGIEGCLMLAKAGAGLVPGSADDVGRELWSALRRGSNGKQKP